MATIREATEDDVDRVRDLFVRVYGKDYPFPGFYDTAWLKRAIFGNDTIFLIAEEGGDVVATGSVILDVGGYNDLVGELGRLVAESSRRAHGAAAGVVKELLARIEGKVQFVFSEVRTVHQGAQRLAEQFGWAAVGFEPMKYRLARRESVVFYVSLKGQAAELRRNNPRVIPELALLAQTALKNCGLPADVIVEDEAEGYPTGRSFAVERLRQDGVSPLLRIERGRIHNREVFGNFSLARGLFRIVDSNSHYLVARDGAAVLGAVGFTHDPIDRKVRIFELIEFDDAAKGFLLAAVDRIAQEEFKAEYQEVDVSAYSPRIQRTFERLGFVPVAYCPSMVFDNVERLDVVRMAKLSARYELGPIRLLENGARLREIVERELEDRILGIELTDAIRNTELFHGLPDGDMYHLARISELRDHKAGEVLIREGGQADRLFILVEGTAEVRVAGVQAGKLGAGALFGEMGLMENAARSADVTLTSDARLIDIDLPRLTRLMEAYPRLGHRIAMNLARSLSAKLRAK